MQSLGVEVLFKGKNFARLMGGMWTALKISLVSIAISMVLGLGAYRLSRRPESCLPDYITKRCRCKYVLICTCCQIDIVCKISFICLMLPQRLSFSCA